MDQTASESSSPALFSRQFPLEILNLILKETLPATLRRDTFSQHANQLCDLSLVHSSFRDWAQRELFRSPFLSRVEQSASFMSVIKARKALSTSVRNLKLFRKVPSTAFVAELLHLTVEVQHLHLSCVGVITLLELSSLPKLEHLVIWGCDLDARHLDTLVMPQLAQVSLCAPATSAGSLTHFLSPTVLPSLRALAFMYVDRDDKPIESPTRLRDILPALEPQLDVLVRGASDHWNSEVTSALPTLWRATWDGHESDDRLADAVEAWKGHGRGEYHAYRPDHPGELGGSLAESTTGDFLAVLKTPVTALAELKVLYAPAELLDCEQWVFDQTVRSRIEKVCKERGIEIVYECHHFLEDSQIPLDFWQRHRKEHPRE